MILSIVIPVYNLADYILNTLDSIYEQNVDESLFGVVVVDDGSTDNTLDLLNVYSKEHTNLVIISQDNKGVSSARNEGFKYVLSDFVTFVDGDDKIFPNSLLKVISLLASHRDCDVLFSNSYFDRQGRFVLKNGVPKDRIIGERYDVREMPLFNNGGCVWGGFYKTSFLRSNSLLFPLNVRNSEDTIFIYSLFANFPVVSFLGVDWYLVTERSGSASRSFSLDRANSFSNNISYLVKNINQCNDNEIKRSYLSAALYQSISQASNMYACCGVRNPEVPYRSLILSEIPKIRTRNVRLTQRIKICLLNLSYSLYFRVLCFMKY